MHDPDMSRLLEELLGTTALPDTEQLMAWRAARTKIARERDALTEAIEKLDKLIETGASLVTKATSAPGVRSKFGFREAARKKLQAKAAKGATPVFRLGSWTEAVYLIVSAADEPLTYAELRAELGKTRNINQVSAWMGAIQRLRDSTHLATKDGLVAVPKVMQQYEQEVNAGTRQPKEGAKLQSAWGNVVCTYLDGCTELASLQNIITGIGADPVIKEKMLRVPSQIYGIIRQLAALGKIEKVGKLYRITPKGRASIKHPDPTDTPDGLYVNGHAVPESQIAEVPTD
jgi:hypothetical protein